MGEHRGTRPGDRVGECWCAQTHPANARGDGSMSQSLPTRALGSSGLEITPVGFGAWAVGGGEWSFGWGPQDDVASLSAMRRALELGVNWIDTAAVYGLGHSEELVGRLLKE